jgi:DNA polymerase V
MCVRVFITEIYRADLTTRCALPLFLVHISAGFPSPADEFIEGRLDLNRHLIKHPAATFFVRVTGIR